MSHGRHVPRIALDRQEAAESIGMSLTSFETYVQPHVKLIRKGSKRLIPVSELERWVSENAQRTLDRHAR
jgi:hypothetical protein